jgi:PEP-CTERM motif
MRAFASALIVLTFAAVAQATPIDPHIVFGSAVASIPLTPVDAFSWQANTKGGGVFNFQNLTGNNWVGVDVFVTLPSDTVIACGPGPFFVTCEVTSKPSATPGMSVFDVGFDEPQDGGITNEAVFSVNMNDPIDDHPNLDPNGKGGWGANTMLTAETTVTPEPASFLMLGGGIVLIGAVRRLCVP